MATCYNGKLGALAVDGTNVARITSWNISESADTVECTAMGDSWKTHVTGISMWEGSCEAIFVDDAEGNSAAGLTVGAEVTITAYPDNTVTGVNYAGSAIITSIETSTAMDDVARVTVNFTGTGALTKDITV